ncbi:pyridoxal phosphate-dependent decarboxylase family protein [Photobacterium angustum]|uniref:pyridoxal phosphate-dependent decarboxylase family protein n=1 Tax=Photobacterium angustum TaxID=661 RepID=UPI0005DC2B05|nr:pyridoxal-dependent decarboxylase [Photobacterium angustum]KJG16525.1 decarboxylase [Photobacterium angustum]KJG22642.1 decarboxylase [Photobacterium angustum]KJG29509.1 decarboxylase [Photobacterium angustum]PSW97880.1 tyrosine decarboxylase [Photobacterium angustum]PSX01933.1 tyrosine decarboxylase [Photobacterium angustum]
MNNSSINISSLFLGPKSENQDTFKKNLVNLLCDHAQWRKDFHPEDPVVISRSEQRESSFVETVDKMESVLDQLSSKLRSNMMPWHSGRYLGHMNTETLMPAMLGYFAGMLYNGNNIAYEGAPATSELEEEIGVDFCHLMGYDENIGWGHLTPDGSTANYEAVWYMRNLKSIPFAVKKSMPKLVEGMDDWALSNMSIDQIMDLLDKVPDQLDDIKACSARNDDTIAPHLGKLLVPETKHYSWLKAADILGIGLNNIETIEVDGTFRMNIDKLKQKIDQLIANKTPILGVVSVVGSTEEGAVDNVNQVVALKNEYAKAGINFYYHIDSAYGGYVRSIFLDEDYNFIAFDKLHNAYKENGVFLSNDVDWPSRDVYEAYKAMNCADSITVDPHKMGYIPYKAGGIVIRDKRMRNTISYFANYCFQKNTQIPDLLGAFVLEGSKSGAAAASVWACHRILDLNVKGYGKIIGASIEGAHNLYNKLKSQKQYDIDGTTVEIHTLCKPDFNMVDYVFNIKGNTDLNVMNSLTSAIYKSSSYYTTPYTNDLIVSHTEFDYDDYKDSPVELIERVGMTKSEWDSIHKVTLIRSCVVNPNLNNKEVFEYYSEQFDKAITHKLREALKEIKQTM